METLNTETIQTVWWGSIAVFAVVIVAVAVLLTLIRSTARQILDGAAAIWTQGKLVANNTIQIPLLLTTTVRGVGKIRAVAEQIAGATASIEQHAESCPGCPHCVLGGGPTGGGS